jgi:septum formation protein
MKRIILASGSPRRKMLLDWAELKFEVIVSDTDESFSSELDPAEVAVSIAQKKNQAVVAQLNNNIVTEEELTTAINILEKAKKEKQDKIQKDAYDNLDVSIE